MGAQPAAVPGLVLTRLLAGAALAACLLLTGCGAFSKKEKEEPPAALTDFESTLRLRQVWSANVGGGGEKLRLGLVPVTDGSRIYAAAHDGRLSAFDAETGRRLWTARTRLPLAGGPGTDGDYVVAGSSNGEVVALSTFDGDEVWRRQLASEVLSAPVLGENLVLVLTVDGRLTALSRPAGEPAWFVQQNVPRLSVRGTGVPVIIRGTVVAGFDNGRIVAYQVIDGTEVWDLLLAPPAGRNEVERLVDINVPLVAVGQDLYAVSYQGRLASLAIESGQVLWSQDLASYSGLAADLGSLYVTTIDGEVVAVNRSNGVVQWRNDLLLRRDLSGPAAWQGSVAVGDFDGYIHLFDAGTGAIQARVRAGRSRIAAQPLVVNDLLIVLTASGDLVAYRQTGRGD